MLPIYEFRRSFTIARILPKNRSILEATAIHSPDNNTDLVRTRIMRIKTKTAMAATVLLGLLLLPVTARALSYTLDADNIVPNQFGPGQAGWFSGNQTFPPTSIGLTPLFIDITLSHSLTANGNLGFGMGGLDPEVQPGALAYSLSIQFYLSGTLVGTDLFDQFNNSPDPAGGIGSGWSDALLNGLVFDEIKITVTSPEERTATSFNISVGVPSAVPDTASTAALLAMSFLGIVALRSRNVKGTA